MRFNAGCLAVLSTLFFTLNVNATNVQRRKFDFHVSNLELGGVRRTVVNGQSISSCLSNTLTYASSVY
jgi:hypothetical protein